MRGLLLAGLISYLYLFPLLVRGQCCSPGTPIGGGAALGVNAAGEWRWLLNTRAGYAGEYFEGSEPSEAVFIQDGRYAWLGSILSYGLNKRLTLEAETGYFLLKTQTYIPGIIPNRLTGRGLTDLNLQLRVNLWRDIQREIEISVGTGIKAPLGSYQSQFQGATLPRDLQPTTGAFEWTQSLFLYKGWLARHIRLFGTLRGEWKGQSPDAYRFGHFLTSSLFVSWSPLARWSFILQGRGEWRGRDTRPLSGNGIDLGNDREQVLPTGSRKYFLIPQISYQFSPDWQLSLLVDMPLYQWYHDRQLATTTAVTLSLSHSWGGASEGVQPLTRIP